MSWLNKKFFSVLSLKKKNIFFVLFFVLWGIFLPGRHAFAAWYDFVISAVTFIPMVAIGVVLVVAVLLSSLLAAFSGEVLTWVTGPSFISATSTWSYTRNPIIDIGLNVTQPFVNMILVLVLVFIALATILRLAGYEVKKLLPTFVLVALLVNFSPVICGLIIDASNIVMNFFLSEITGGKQLISMLDSVGDTIVGMVGNWANFRADQNVPLLLMMAVSIVVNLGLFLILLLFAFIFMARYLAIWILVILSPLAFVCYILPATRKFWNLWWNQFVQWSIIGITMAFFLYLADQFATLNPTQFGMGAVSAGGIGGAILPALVPLVFLYLGFTFGLTTGAMGATGVMNITKKYGKRGAVYGGYGAKALAARALGSEAAEKRGVKEKLTKMGETPLPGFKGKSVGGKIATGLGYATGALPLYWAVRRGAGEATQRLTESGKKDVAMAEDNYKETTAESKVAAMRDVRIGWSHRIAALNQAIKENQIDDIRKLGIKDEEIQNIGKAALRTSPETFKGIRDAFPHLAEQAGKGFSDNLQKQAKVNLQQALNQGYKSVKEKIIAEMKPPQVAGMDSSILHGPTADPGAKAAAYKFWQAGHWAEAGKSFGRKFCDEVRTDFLDSPTGFTQSAQKYFTSSPAGKSLYGI